ncbi:Sec-independent protein translocase protein TatA [Paenibacillus sp. CECT 9249]|uniref:twin-arginine translocase TatA/TatE family subunit n=1 Tax=Paenibacillus sp. CECT 9249 TaxID=2845385 RepID=UPI001E566B69|nr:twin-arginine translocase TatA/TatE family subunit [Paenibacillus sp. CECT 9249]CAH0119414.1 Sec-independent protein translocase protein TatA [Paenibacillus sp. CECT 9249]
MGGSGIGVTGFILLIVVALLLFGPNKLPELGRAFGRTLREFKAGARDIISDDDDLDRKDRRREVRTIDETPQSSSTEDKRANDRRLPD